VVKFLLAGGAVGAGLLAHVGAQEFDAIEALASVLLFALACELYMFLFSVVSGSITVSILLALDRCCAPANDLEALYPSHGMVSRRLEKLVSSGLLAEQDTGYLITSEGRRLIATFGRLRRFFGHE